MQECTFSKKIILQIAVKAINDIAGPNSLIPTLLVFGAHPCILEFNTFIVIIIQHIAIIKNIMKDVQKVRAENQIADTLN